MIRLSTFIWLALAVVVVAGLFHLKYEVQDQERALRQIRNETAAIRLRTQTLYAEWNQLNRPDRLRKLLAARDRLAPVAGEQLREFSELPGSLDGDPRGPALAGRPVRVAARTPNRSSAPPGDTFSDFR